MYECKLQLRVYWISIHVDMLYVISLNAGLKMV